MAHTDADLLTIEQDAERNRRALTASVEEIGRRVQPKNIVLMAQRRIGGEAWKTFDRIREAVKDERGKVVVLVAGAVAAFYLGRSTQPRAPYRSTLNSAESVIPSAEKNHNFGLNLVSEKTGAFARNARKLAAAAAAVASGYAIGSAAPISRAEKEVMGEASARVKDYAAEFRRVHSRGARIAAVQSLGVAQLAAAAIGLMGALASLVGDRGKSRQSSDAANPL